MKILLLGEFSGLHKNLKEGLLELGHEVIVAAHGDGFKKIPADISFDPYFSGRMGNIERVFRPLTKLNHMKGFDVVQLISPFSFYYEKLPYSLFPTDYFFNQVIGGNKKFFMLAAGDDAFFWRYGRKALAYGPFDDFLKYDAKSNFYFMQSEKSLEMNKKLVDRSRGVIPVMYEYEISYKDSTKRLPTIPLPMNVNKIEYRENRINQKLVVFHGLNRYGFKGTRHIEEAFKILEKKYPNDLELIIDGNMPLNKYLSLMQRTNVVIDQLNSYSLGMNGVYALAMGKVVLGGAEPESLKSMGVHSSPVINVRPSASNMVESVEQLLDQRYRIQEMGAQSRVFAEKVHGHIRVAELYIDTWNRH